MSSLQELQSAKFLTATDGQQSEEEPQHRSTSSAETFAKWLSAVTVMAICIAGSTWLICDGEEWFASATKPIQAPAIDLWGKGSRGHAGNQYDLRNNVEFQQHMLEMEYEQRDMQRRLQESISTFK